MIKIIAALLGASLLILPMTTARVAVETTVSSELEASHDSELVELLAAIPRKAFADKYISYLDLGTLLQYYPPLELPKSSTIPVESRNTDEMWRQINVFMSQGVAAGPANLLMHYRHYEDIFEVSGLNLFSITRMLDIGMPPNQQMWLEGDIDAVRLNEVLTGRGYEKNDLKENKPFMVMSPEGDMNAGTVMDFESIDTAFVFGGQLGQRWPLLFNDERIMTSSSGEAVLAAAKLEEGNSIADIPEVSDLLSEMSSTPEGVMPLTQMYILDTTFAINNEEFEIMEEGQLLGIAELFYDDANYIHLSATFSDEAKAEAHAKTIKKKMEDQILLMNGQPLQEVIKATDASFESIRVTKGENGTVTLTLPVRATIQEPTLQMKRTPFNLFRSMVLTRDMDWFLVSDTTP